MAIHCPVCNSTDTQTLVDRDQCLACGQHFTIDGPAKSGLDTAGRDALRAAADKTHEPSLVPTTGDIVLPSDQPASDALTTT